MRRAFRPSTTPPRFFSSLIQVNRHGTKKAQLEVQPAASRDSGSVLLGRAIFARSHEPPGHPHKIYEGLELFVTPARASERRSRV